MRRITLQTAGKQTEGFRQEISCARTSNLTAAALLHASNSESVEYLLPTSGFWHMLYSLLGMFPSPLFSYPPDLINSCLSLRSQVTCYLLREALLTSPTRSTDSCFYDLCSMLFSSIVALICTLIFVCMFIWLMPVFPTKCSPTILSSYNLHGARARTLFIMVPCIPGIVLGSKNSCGINEWITLHGLWEKSRAASFSHCFSGGLWPGSLFSHPFPSFRMQPFHCRDRKGRDTKVECGCLCLVDYVCQRNSHYHSLVGPNSWAMAPDLLSDLLILVHLNRLLYCEHSEKSVNTTLSCIRLPVDPLPISIWHRTGWSWTSF